MTPIHQGDQEDIVCCVCSNPPTPTIQTRPHTTIRGLHKQPKKNTPTYPLHLRRERVRRELVLGKQGNEEVGHSVPVHVPNIRCPNRACGVHDARLRVGPVPRVLAVRDKEVDPPTVVRTDQHLRLGLSLGERRVDVEGLRGAGRAAPGEVRLWRDKGEGGLIRGTGEERKGEKR